MRSILGLALGLVAASPALAQGADPHGSAPQAPSERWRPPTLSAERYKENWSDLADEANRTGRWTEPFKYVPLANAGAVYLTTGLEARLRYEGFKGLAFGDAPDQGYVWQRLLPYADLHVGRLRVFAQPILAYADGVEPSNGPVDRTGADLLQGFAELDLPVGDGANLRLAVGRQLFGLGSERLVGTRYGPNVPQAFDGARAVLDQGRQRLTVFYQRPVEGGQGDFDDRTSRRRALWGAYATRMFDQGGQGIDLYYLGYLDKRAVADQGAGHQKLHTVGTRVFGAKADWHWNIEAAVQTGRFAGARMRTWTWANEVGRRFPNAPLKPDLTVTADIVSGDKDPASPRFQGFNPLFPKGKYFGALSPIGPRNIIDVHPAVTLDLGHRVAVTVAGMAYWRQSLRDGVYDVPGRLVRSGKAGGARFIGKQAEVAAGWQATPELNLSASASVFKPGAFIAETGLDRTISMLSLEANFRF